MNVCEIPLTKGCVAIVDSADYPLLTQHRWALDANGRYAVARIGPRITRRHVRMHRYLLNEPVGMTVDHVNGHGLDNRRANLRIATLSQNSMNRMRLMRTNLSGVNGIHWYPPYGKWRTRVTVNRKQIHLGYFATLEEAIAVRRAAELRYYGEFAPSRQP